MGNRETIIHRTTASAKTLKFHPDIYRVFLHSHRIYTHFFDQLFLFSWLFGGGGVVSLLCINRAIFFEGAKGDTLLCRVHLCKSRPHMFTPIQQYSRQNPKVAKGTLEAWGWRGSRPVTCSRKPPDGPLVAPESDPFTASMG